MSDQTRQQTVTPATPAEPMRVMAIYAHPDDPEFFSGGALAKWSAEGKELFYVLATSGDKGTDDPDMTTEKLMAIRESEQRAAAAVLGSKNVFFLQYRDNELEPDLKLRRDLTRMIRLHKPDIVVTNDPQTFWFKGGGVNHPDHRAIGEATLAAVYPAARDRWSFVELWKEEGLEPHKVRRVYLSGTIDPNMRVNITSVWEKKIAAIMEHKSQVKDPEGMLKRQRDNTDAEIDEENPVYSEFYRVLTLR